MVNLLTLYVYNLQNTDWSADELAENIWKQDPILTSNFNITIYFSRSIPELNRTIKSYVIKSINFKNMINIPEYSLI